MLDISPTPVFLCTFSILVLLCLHAISSSAKRSRLAQSKGCEPATSRAPLADPYIGLDFLWGLLIGRGPESGAMDRAHWAFSRMGPTYTSKRWTWETIYTCDSRNVKHMLATNFDDFELPWVRTTAMSSLLGHGIFTLNGGAWSRARATLKPCFGKPSREALHQRIERHCQALFQRIYSVNESQSVDLQPLFFALAMDVATDVLANRSTSMLGNANDKEKRFVDDYMTCAEEVTQRMQMGPLQIFTFSSQASQARDRVFAYIDDFVGECLQQQQQQQQKNPDVAVDAKRDVPERRCDVLQALAKATGKQDCSLALRDQLLHVLLASRDTTASLLSSLFFVLARRPDVFARLRSDVLHVAGAEAPPSADQLGEMRYLKWCIQEALRLYPPVPTNTRSAVRDTILPRGGGQDGLSPLFVSRGTVVVYDVYSMHRDETVYGPNADIFRPERWDGLRPGWAYLPFSGGSRVCLGQSFALQEVHYIVARMAQTFEAISSRDDRPWLERYALTMTCRNGVHCVLKRTSLA